MFEAPPRWTPSRPEKGRIEVKWRGGGLVVVVVVVVPGRPSIFSPAVPGPVRGSVCRVFQGSRLAVSVLFSGVGHFGDPRRERERKDSGVAAGV